MIVYAESRKLLELYSCREILNVYGKKSSISDQNTLICSISQSSQCPASVAGRGVKKLCYCFNMIYNNLSENEVSGYCTVLKITILSIFCPFLCSIRIILFSESVAAEKTARIC